MVQLCWLNITQPTAKGDKKTKPMTIKKLMTLFSISAVLFFSSCNNDDDNGSMTIQEDPSVEATSPISEDNNVALNKTVSVSFNQMMDASTINAESFTLKQGNTRVAGTVSYDEFTAIFEPNETLSENTEYTANITNAVKNEAGVAISPGFEWKFTTGINVAGMDKINLRSSGNYTILAKTAINNSPTSEITGDLGLSPAATTYITGFSLVDATGYATSSQVTGKVYAADMAEPTSTDLTTAVEDMNLAYTDAAGRTNPNFNELSTGDIGGKTLVSGLYKWTSTVTVPSNVVISGSSSDIWIFQIAGDLTVSSDVSITLSGGAKAENIFWQVAGEVNLGTNSEFKGIILSMSGITLQTDATLTGRALAQTAVILDQNTVKQP